MANLQIKGMDDGLYAEIKFLAAQENRSVSQQVIFLIREFLSRKGREIAGKPAAAKLLELAGSWEDHRTAEEIITELKASRRNSPRLSKGL